ncbi:hypothetical protein EON80_05910 [bacterium]|nr:MAG: hypothetical protein EON80_05910 [bacterium]
MPDDPLLLQQLALCAKYGATPYPCSPGEKLDIALNVKAGELPVHGVRLEPENGTCGWFIWSGGEMSEAEDFFAPLHVAHVDKWSPLIARFLQLPPGWRFLVAPDYEDVWFDENPEESGSVQ